MNFLPKDYKTPEASSKYLKLEQGETVIRVLDRAITGWEWWTEEDGKRTPKRVKSQDDITDEQLAEINKAEEETGREQLKHFWIFPVWDYSASQVKVLEITQRSIQKAISGYISNEKWGDPTEYDLIINKSGEKLQTRYNVTVNPKEKLDDKIVKQFKNMTMDLEKLYENGDPFKIDLNDVPDFVK